MGTAYEVRTNPGGTLEGTYENRGNAEAYVAMARSEFGEHYVVVEAATGKVVYSTKEGEP